MAGRNARGNPDGPETTGMSDDERGAVVGSLAQEMTELFHEYTRGEIGFEELSFEMYDTLQTLHALASGNVTIEYYDDAGEFEETPDDILRGPSTDSGNGRKGAGKRNEKGKPRE
jgi:hypothetical protein